MDWSRLPTSRATEVVIEADGSLLVCEQVTELPDPDHCRTACFTRPSH